MANQGGPLWLAQFLYSKGLRGDKLATAWAIAMRESGGNPRVDNAGLNHNGSTDYGLFQINNRAHADDLRRHGWTVEDLRDPEKNFILFMETSNNVTNLGAWNMGPNAYDPSMSAKHTAAFEAEKAKFARYAAKASIPLETSPNDGNTTGKTDRLSEAELAEKYGYALAVIKQDPELQSIFQQAFGTKTSGQWNTTRFIAAVRATKWYRKHQESWRFAENLKFTDPAQYNAKLARNESTIRNAAKTMGAVLTDGDVATLAWRMLHYDWDQTQMGSNLAPFIKSYKTGGLGGSAGQVEDALKTTAWKNGVTMSDDFYVKAARAIAAGGTQEEWDDYIRKQAATLFPVFQKQIEAGVDVRDLASGYINVMASAWEMDPSNIGLDNPYIKQALSGFGPDGKPAAMGLWDFEKKIKQDPKWAKTKNATNTVASAITELGQTFGFLG